jgi:DNA-directed RNA polymerase subunit L
MVDSLSVDTHFVDKNPALKAAYDRLLAELRQFGPVREVAKKTSIHLEKNAGFAGVHPRKDSFNLEFRTDYKIDHPAITRTQQLSARRFEHTVKLTQESDVNETLLQWLKDAYELSK